MAEGIVQWLAGLGLGRYAEAFAENAIDLDVVADLTDDDLRDLAIPLGDRKRLLRAIAGMRVGAASAAEAAVAPPSSPPPAEAERRQLTVLFCDLVGSTALAARLDPEDMRDVLRAYQDACAGVIARFDGYVAKFMGDGVYAYFGYPTAHEDDAERAVNAGLGIVDALGALGRDLKVRIGVATGTVAVGDIVGAGASEEAAIVGEAPNLAARLQEIAEPDTVVIGEATYALAGGLFETAELGARDLKGFAEPVAAWSVVRPRRAESRFEATRGERLTELVGRDEELEILLRRWERTKQGEGQVALISGEPGIGKSRLVHAFRQAISGEPHAPLAVQCSPHYDNSALHPIIQNIEQRMGLEPDDSAMTRLDKLEAWIAMGRQTPEEVAPIVGSLLGIDTSERFAVRDIPPQRRKELLFEILNDRLTALAAARPCLIVVEDAHWSDPTSLELLSLHIERARDVAALVIVTYRPEFAAPWVGESQTTLLALARLDRRQCAALATKVDGAAALPADMIERIAARADGVPLFVEELTKAVLESSAGAPATSDVEVPATLQDSLEARLDRLGPAREIAQIGAVIGREFGHGLLAQVSGMAEDDLRAGLDRLVDSELVHRRGQPPDATYGFKHALVQDTAYASLLRSRRADLHRTVARVLERSFPDTVASEPETMAHHLTEAGAVPEAVSYWHIAGDRSARRSAFAEAERHYAAALDLLSGEPPTRENQEKELALRLALGPVLMSAKGMAAPGVSDNYTRAQELGHVLDDFPRRFAALFGLWTYSVQVDGSAAGRLSNDMLALAAGRSESDYLLQAHHAAWTSAFVQGRFGASIEHSRLGWDIYDPEAHRGHAFLYGGHDPGVCSRTFSACADVLQGRIEGAERRLEEARNLADSLSHPATTGATFAFSAMAFQMSRDPARALHFAEATIRHCQAAGLSRTLWANAAMAVRGWTLAVLESDGAAIAEIEASIGRLTAAGTAFYFPYLHGMLADAQHHLGRRDEAHATVQQALALSDRRGERWWRPELHRIMGRLQEDMSPDHAGDAEASFRESIDAARRLEATMLELRAATSLARLWRSQGRTGEARDLLAPVYGGFTEGFETADLKDAKALLDELG